MGLTSTSSTRPSTSGCDAVTDTARYDRIYELAEPYWQTRSNEVHVPGAYALAQELVAAHPEADPDVVLPAILLHDIGYMAVPAEDHLKGLAGAARGWEPDITRRHEIQGAALAGRSSARSGGTPRGSPRSSTSSTATTRAARR